MKIFIKRKTVDDGSRPIIKIQIDYKTIITVRSLEAFEKWKSLFPEARIVS